jgi:hypothetical protein
MLFRARMMASLLTVLLAVLVFLAAQEMFSTGAAFVALTLLVFDPNLLAHGPLVTTDTGLSCFLFASVYAFYRYVKAPTAWRLVAVGLATGLAFAAKHTGVLAAPTLIVLALCEVWRSRGAQGRRAHDLHGRSIPAHVRCAGRRGGNLADRVMGILRIPLLGASGRSGFESDVGGVSTATHTS